MDSTDCSFCWDGVGRLKVDRKKMLRWLKAALLLWLLLLQLWILPSAGHFRPDSSYFMVMQSFMNFAGPIIENRVQQVCRVKVETLIGRTVFQAMLCYALLEDAFFIRHSGILSENKIDLMVNDVLKELLMVLKGPAWWLQGHPCPLGVQQQLCNVTQRLQDEVTLQMELGGIRVDRLCARYPGLVHAELRAFLDECGVGRAWRTAVILMLAIRMLYDDEVFKPLLVVLDAPNAGKKRRSMAMQQLQLLSLHGHVEEHLFLGLLSIFDAVITRLNVDGFFLNERLTFIIAIDMAFPCLRDCLQQHFGTLMALLRQQGDDGDDAAFLTAVRSRSLPLFSVQSDGPNTMLLQEAASSLGLERRVASRAQLRPQLLSLLDHLDVALVTLHGPKAHTVLRSMQLWLITHCQSTRFLSIILFLFLFLFTLCCCCCCLFLALFFLWCSCGVFLFHVDLQRLLGEDGQDGHPMMQVSLDFVGTCVAWHEDRAMLLDALQLAQDDLQHGGCGLPAVDVVVKAWLDCHRDLWDLIHPQSVIPGQKLHFPLRDQMAVQMEDDVQRELAALQCYRWPGFNFWLADLSVLEGTFLLYCQLFQHFRLPMSGGKAYGQYSFVFPGEAPLETAAVHVLMFLYYFLLHTEERLALVRAMLKPGTKARLLHEAVSVFFRPREVCSNIMKPTKAVYLTRVSRFVAQYRPVFTLIDALDAILCDLARAVAT